MIYARIVLLSPPFAELTYALPAHLPADAWRLGQRVVVPLGKGCRVGVLLALNEPAPEGVAVKPLVWPLEHTPLLPLSHLDLAMQIAKRQGAGLGQILAGILPQGLRTTQTRIRFFGEGKPVERRVNALPGLPPEDLDTLGRLWVAGRAEVCAAGGSGPEADLCALAVDPPWPVRPAAHAQIALLEYLLANGAVRRDKLLAALGAPGARALPILCERGLVAVRPGDDAPCAEPTGECAESPGFDLTPEQRGVFEPLLQAALAGAPSTHLLFGITGSGKTAVYLELARAVLAGGASVMLLAPEVALALKLWRDAATHLPEARRFLFHGYQSPTAKEKTFRELSGNPTPSMIIGTRSALFLPVERPGLIILDEEHDASFKQDEGLTYQAKEVAWYRARQAGALLLLGSATPDVKSFHAAKEGRVPLHVLENRVGGGTLPGVELVQLPKGRADNNLLAPQSMEALAAVVRRGEQAVILLNRRGWSPIMYCLGCGATVKCPHCEIGLTYHKGRERLVCHYCGFSTPFPSPCSACGGLNFLPMGEGTEKLEEELAGALPPGAGILRLDRDSTRRPGRMEEILEAFARKEAQVLVGTQMLSKGHHFPDVTLAVAADADLGLNLPDYRAAERTFQLLVQASGRAGRGEAPGRVLIQTRDPSHYCWQYVLGADYAGFYERELDVRRRRRYPPFVRLGLLRISFAVEDSGGFAAVEALGAALRPAGRDLGVSVLGPAPAPLPLLKGRRRFHCLLKAGDWQPMRDLYALARAQGKNLRIGLDLDPVNML